MQKILIVRPVLNDYLPPSRSYYEVLSHSLAMEIKRKAWRTKTPILDLNWTGATRQGFELVMERDKDIKIVVILSHGEKEGKCAMGQGIKPLLDMLNVGYLKDKGAYLICCHAAKSLGPLAVNEEGCDFFIGFRDKLYLASKKVEWVVAHCLLHAMRLIMEGVDPEEAWERMQKKHANWIRKIIDQHSDDEEWLVGAAILDWNMEQLTFLSRKKIRKGGYVVPKLTKSPKLALSKEKIEKAIEAAREWAKKPSAMATETIAAAGMGDELSPAEIVAILEERQEKDDWGHDDPPERFLMILANR